MSLFSQPTCLTLPTGMHKGAYEMEDMGKRMDQRYSQRAQTANPSRCWLNWVSQIPLKETKFRSQKLRSYGEWCIPHRGKGREGDGKCSNVDPLGGPEPPPFQPWDPVSVGPREQEIWLGTVGLHRKEEPGGYGLRAKATSSVSSTAPSSGLLVGRDPCRLLEGAEVVVVNGQLVMQPRASPRQDQSVKKVRVNDSGWL